MSGAPKATGTAFRVADLLRADAPWEVYAENVRRYEVHLNGRSVEMVRGPISLEGYGIRLVRARNGTTGFGFQASTDLSEAGIRAATQDAESVAAHAEFPARKVDLPTGSRGAGPDVEIVDRKLWDDPMGTIDAYVAELLRSFDGKRDVVPSFGSVRATLAQTTIANSAGVRASFPHTVVDFEVAVKASGGPEGPPPGEYWVNSTGRRLESERLAREVERWCQDARDARTARPPPTGELPVALPAEVLAGILPPVFGYRFTGAARLRKLAPAEGDRVAADSLSITDDGLRPWAPASFPVDAEGAERAGRPVVAAGKVVDLLYDSAHAAAFDRGATASAERGVSPGGYADWRRFAYSPRVSTSTLSVAPGTGGSDAEVIESAKDGIWVQQLGWAYPDPISGAFGGEIRLGYRIRNGRIAEPLRGGTVGGVVLAPPGRPSMLSQIVTVGSTVELAGAVAAPSILVRPLVVAGAEPPSSTSKPRATSRRSSGTSRTGRRAGSPKKSR